MTFFSTIYKLSLVAAVCFTQGVLCSRCPVLECWFVQEKSGRGGPTGNMNQERSLLHISTATHSPLQKLPSDINPDRIYTVTDPAGSLCHRSLDPPSGSIKKPFCETNPFLPYPSILKWAAPLTDSETSPHYLQANWFSTTSTGINKELTISSIMRAPTASKELSVILSATTKTVSVQARLGKPVRLDCSFWIDPSSPLSGSGFAVEWRYQFRGKGRVVLAYNSKTDRLADEDEGATLDFNALHQRGDASLILQKAEVHRTGMYICTVYLPYLAAQVTMELEVVETPSLSIHPSPLPLTVPGQILSVQCDASGFAPLSLQLSWQYKDVNGKNRHLGSGRVTGHRQAWDGTYSQSSRLDLDTATVDLSSGGELICVAHHLGDTREARVTLNMLGFSTPTIEDSMAMVGVALVLYGLIKFISWTFTSSASGEAEKPEKKDN